MFRYGTKGVIEGVKPADYACCEAIGLNRFFVALCNVIEHGDSKPHSRHTRMCSRLLKHKRQREEGTFCPCFGAAI